MALGSEFQLAIECKLRLGSRNRQFHWTHGIRLYLGMPLPLMSHYKSIIFGLEQKLGFCLVRDIAIFARGGQNQ